MTFIWISVCIVSIIAELVTPTALISIWFAVGGIIAIILSLLSLPIWIQVISFLVVSIISMLVVRPIASSYLRGNVVATNADRCIGQTGIVLKKITTNEWGEVKVRGTLWHAISYENQCIDVEEKVKIIAIDGVKLVVKKIH